MEDIQNDLFKNESKKETLNDFIFGNLLYGFSIVMPYVTLILTLLFIYLFVNYSV